LKGDQPVYKVGSLAYFDNGQQLLVHEHGLSVVNAASGEITARRNWITPHYGVSGFALSPDGKRILAFGGTYEPTAGAPNREGVIAELELDLKGDPELSTSRRCPDNCGAISADGKWLVTAGHAEGGRNRDYSVVVRDLKKNEVVKAFDAAIILHPHYNNEPIPLDISSVRFSPDSKLLAVAGGKRPELFDATDDFKPAGELTGHTESVNRVAFDQDGKLLASVSRDGTARIWDVKAKKELHKLALKNTTHKEAVDVTFSPDGKLVATADNTEVKLWDAATGKEVRTLETKLKGPSCVAFSPDGKHIAVGFADLPDAKKPVGGVEQFVVETGKPRELKAKK
jgi:WD40 repeat protein